MGESYVEEAIGEELLAISGLELGYCARMGEVDLRVIGSAAMLEQADASIRAKLTTSILSTSGENLETVIVRQLSAKRATLAVAESCTGGFLAHRLTNVPGSSEVFLAGYVTYSNEAKNAALGVDLALDSRRTVRSANRSPGPWRRARWRNQARPTRLPPPALPAPAAAAKRNRSERLSSRLPAAGRRS